MSTSTVHDTNGSSPLARGNTVPGSAGQERFIPARAGNTQIRDMVVLPLAMAPACDSTVHPRSRGEHADRRLPTRSRDHKLAMPSRFIPARAGNTWTKARTSRGNMTPVTCDPVHPRSRGEHLMRFIPLARGTPSGPSCPLPGRFIPARAGNTPACQRTNALQVNGSSPLARGTPRPSYGNRTTASIAQRFIPARAGNTAPARNGSVANTGRGDRQGRSVHPRSRGEHTRYAAAQRRRQSSVQTAVHPRSRGEHQPGQACGSA